MNKQYLSRLIILMFAAGAVFSALAEDSHNITSIKVTFPAVKLACISFQLPTDAANAEATIEKALREWYAAARAGKLPKSGYPYIDATIARPTKDSNTTSSAPIDARMCAVIEEAITSIPSMDIVNGSEVDGFVGFCTAPNVKDCLDRAFKDSGFTQEKPWPRLPIYARWPDEEPDPSDSANIIKFLSTPAKEIPPEMSGQGNTYERNTNGLQKLVPCDASGCPQQTTANKPEESKRIGWFIPALPPPPSPPRTNPSKD